MSWLKLANSPEFRVVESVLSQACDMMTILVITACVELCPLYHFGLVVYSFDAFLVWENETVL